MTRQGRASDIVEDFDRDRFLTAGEARAYGLIDAIVGDVAVIGKEQGNG